MVNMIKFQFKLICKTPIMHMMFLVYPVLLTLIIGYLTQDSFGGEVSSYEYYSIGMMVFLFVGSGLISVYNFLDDNVKSGNVRTMFTPNGEFSVYFSQIVSSTSYASIAVAFSMSVFNLLFKVSYNGNALIIWLAFSILCFTSNALGMFLCTKLSGSGPINLVFNLIQSVFCILGGAFFSLESLGGIPAMISRFSPVKWFMDGVLNSIYDNNVFIIILAIFINIIIALGLIFLTSRSFKVEKYL